MERQINAWNRATQATVAAVATVRSSLASTPSRSTPTAAAAAVVSANNAQSNSARDLQRALDDAARAEEERINKQEAAYKSFADSVKSTFGAIKESILSAFNLTDLGNSVNSITRNIQKLLSRTRDFARNITSLSQQGLTNDLLQQVIAAGPMQGGRLAQALATGGTGFIRQINQAYSEFGGLAGSIAGVGTRTAFGNQQTINNYIEINGGLATGADVGRAVVNAIKDFERQSGAAWRA
jgi:vacuolar-type H+-ATPase subunit E/Vma4